MKGIAEMLRCWVCLRTGAWGERERDVQEVDVDKLRAQVAIDPAPVTERRP